MLALGPLSLSLVPLRPVRLSEPVGPLISRRAALAGLPALAAPVAAMAFDLPFGEGSAAKEAREAAEAAEKEARREKLQRARKERMAAEARAQNEEYVSRMKSVGFGSTVYTPLQQQLDPINPDPNQLAPKAGPDIDTAL